MISGTPIHAAGWWVGQGDVVRRCTVGDRPPGTSVGRHHVADTRARGPPLDIIHISVSRWGPAPPESLAALFNFVSPADSFRVSISWRLQRADHGATTARCHLPSVLHRLLRGHLLPPGYDGAYASLVPQPLTSCSSLQSESIRPLINKPHNHDPFRGVKDRRKVCFFSPSASPGVYIV